MQTQGDDVSSIPATGSSAPTTTRAAGWVAPLCWIAVLLDGFDLVVVGTVVPTLQKPEEWALSGAGTTFVITIGLVGMMIGALTIGMLTDLVGRRKALIGAVITCATPSSSASRRSWACCWSTG